MSENKAQVDQIVSTATDIKDPTFAREELVKAEEEKDLGRKPDRSFVKDSKIKNISFTKKGCEKNNESKAQWSRSDKIGFASLLVAVISIVFSATNPEVRKFVGLEASDSPSSVTLKSDYSADYSKLQYLLASKQFQEADIETTRLLLWAARREKQGVLNTESIKRFSCTDFRTIDNLWRQYSNGRFGFSLQMRIWQKITPQDPEEFASKIGWINYDKSWVKYNDLTFDLRAPIGHLPTGGAFMPSGNLKGNWFYILSNQCF